MICRILYDRDLNFCFFFLFFPLFFVKTCILKTVLAKFFSLFVMTFNKTYASVVRLKKGIQIVRQKENWTSTRRIKTGQKNSRSFSKHICCSSGTNKDFKVNQIHGQHRSFEYHPCLFPHLAFLKV